MKELSSEEKYRLGIISREQRELDMMNEEYDEGMKKIDYGEFVLGGTEDAKKLRELAADIKKKHNKLAQDELQKKEDERNREYRQYSSSTDGIIQGAKAKYDEKMNAYMNMNLWGKAKTILAGKKPKKMSGNEIMQTYASEITQIELQRTIEMKKRDYEEDIAWTKSYYTEHPEDLKPDSETYNSIENIIASKQKRYAYEIKQLEEKYARMLQNANELVSEFGIDHFEQKSSMSR